MVTLDPMALRGSPGASASHGGEGPAPKALGPGCQLYGDIIKVHLNMIDRGLKKFDKKLLKKIKFTIFAIFCYV